MSLFGLKPTRTAVRYLLLSFSEKCSGKTSIQVILDGEITILIMAVVMKTVFFSRPELSTAKAI